MLDNFFDPNCSLIIIWQLKGGMYKFFQTWHLNVYFLNFRGDMC